MTTIQLRQRAVNATHRVVDMQDACNLTAILYDAHMLANLLCDLTRHSVQGTDWRNRHPIAILYASKVASLTGLGGGDTYAFSRAADWCRGVVEGRLDPLEGYKT